MSYEYIHNPTADDKMRLMKFVYDNTDSFILNTFGFVWESRQWWDNFPVQIMHENGEIIGLHAYTRNTKAPDMMKTYYIITNKNHRGKGVAKKLILTALEDSKYDCTTYFVNSEEGSEGIPFFNKLFDSKYTIKINEFGTNDYLYTAPIKELLFTNQ